MSDSQKPFDENAVLTTILVVRDIAKSKHFYTENLGAELYREYGGDSVVINLLGSWVLLVTEGGETEDKPGTEFRVPKDRNRISHSFTIRVENCQQTYKQLTSKGVDFLTPPIQRGAETRCFFFDPDGHLFEISEYASKAK